MDALVRRAHACEQVRDWAGVVAALEAVQHAPLADAFARERARATLAWARPALDLAARARWPDRGVALLCDDPLRAERRGDGGVLSWCVPGGRGALLGVPVRYRGGPLRVSYRFRLRDVVQWETEASLGLVRLQAAPPAAARGRTWAASLDGPALYVRLFGEGATRRPLLTATLQFLSRDGRQAAARASDVDLAGAEEHVLQLDYVPGQERVWAEVRGADGRERLALRVDLPAPLEWGDYLVGRASPHRVERDLPAEADTTAGPTPFELLEVVVEAADVGTGPAPSEPATAWELLLAGGGALVEGDAARADELLGRALDAAPDDAGLRVRVHVLRAVARLRAGGAAGDDVRAALELDGAGATRLLRFVPHLRPDEVEALARLLPSEHAPRREWTWPRER